MRRSLISTLLGIVCVTLAGCGPQPIVSAPPAKAVATSNVMGAADPMLAADEMPPGVPAEPAVIPASETAVESPPLKPADTVPADEAIQVESTDEPSPPVANEDEQLDAENAEPQADDASAPQKTPAIKPVQTKPAAVKRYEFRRKHDPNGIGKFYMGREIAHVMGFIAADWLERDTREEEERLTLLLKELDLKPGTVAADVGAGSGRITLMMAEQVGAEGKVLAIDVQQKMLDLLARKIKQSKIDNVELILGTAKSPKMKPGILDLALMVDVYHEFEWPHEMLLEISNSLKPGGRLVFVEYRMEDPAVNIKLVHKMTEAQVKKEAGLPEFKLKWKETIESLPQQHMVIFERLADDEKKSTEP